MATQIKRNIFTVGLHEGLWAVENEGRFYDHTKDKDVAKAAANRRARAAEANGDHCQVRVNGELGYFSGS